MLGKMTSVTDKLVGNVTDYQIKILSQTVQFKTTYGIIPRSSSVVATKFFPPLLIYYFLCMYVCVCMCVCVCVWVCTCEQHAVLEHSHNNLQQLVFQWDCSSVWALRLQTHTHTHTPSHLRTTQHAHNNTNSKHSSLYRVTSVWLGEVTDEKGIVEITLPERSTTPSDLHTCPHRTKPEQSLFFSLKRSFVR